jgi:hypothetical protein
VRSGQKRVQEMRECLWSLASQGELEDPSTGRSGHVEYRASLFGDGSAGMKPRTGSLCDAMAGGENLSPRVGDIGQPLPTEQTRKKAASRF